MNYFENRMIIKIQKINLNIKIQKEYLVQIFNKKKIKMNNITFNNNKKKIHKVLNFKTNGQMKKILIIDMEF